MDFADTDDIDAFDVPDADDEHHTPTLADVLSVINLSNPPRVDVEVIRKAKGGKAEVGERQPVSLRAYIESRQIDKACLLIGIARPRLACYQHLRHLVQWNHGNALAAMADTAHEAVAASGAPPPRGIFISNLALRAPVDGGPSVYVQPPEDALMDPEGDKYPTYAHVMQPGFSDALRDKICGCNPTILALRMQEAYDSLLAFGASRGLTEGTQHLLGFCPDQVVMPDVIPDADDATWSKAGWQENAVRRLLAEHLAIGGAMNNKSVELPESPMEVLALCDSMFRSHFEVMFNALTRGRAGSHLAEVIDEDLLIYQLTNRMRVTGVSECMNALTSETMRDGILARFDCIALLTLLARETTRMLRGVRAELVSFVDRVRHTQNFRHLTPRGRQHLESVAKAASKFKSSLEQMLLPSGRLLCPNVDVGPQQVMECAARRTMALATREKLVIHGSDVLAEIRVGSDVCGLTGGAQTGYVVCETHSAITPQLKDSRSLLRHHRSVRRQMSPFYKDEPVYNTSVFQRLMEVKDLVAHAHAEDQQSGPEGPIRSFLSSPSIIRSLPDVLAYVQSDTLRVYEEPNRHRRAFMDGMIDVSVNAVDMTAASPIVIPHAGVEDWERYLASGEGGRAVKFYQYPMSGRPRSGKPRYLDPRTNHTYPIAPFYRSIITRQPGCRLTHIYNVATDGAMLYRRGDVDARQVAKLLVGNSKTGKSTHVDVICDLYPPELTGNISGSESVFGLQDFTPDKMLAFAQEMGPTMGVSSTVLQSAIASDIIRLAVKHGRASEFRWRIPIVMAGNLLGPWLDTSGSMLRRLLMWIYSLRFPQESPNIKYDIESDMGGVVLCMFTTYRDLAVARRRWVSVNQPASKDADPDMFSAPAPAYLRRTRLHYAGHISRIVRVIEDHPHDFVFSQAAYCSLAELTSRLNIISEAANAASQKNTHRSQEKFDDTTVAASFALFGCVRRESIIQGVSIRKGNDVNFTMRLAAMMVLGIDTAAQAWADDQYGGGAAAPAAPAAAAGVGLGDMDDMDDDPNGARDQAAAAGASIPAAARAFVHNLPTQLDVDHPPWPGATEELYLSALEVLHETGNRIRRMAEIADTSAAHQRAERVMWDPREMAANIQNPAEKDLMAPVVAQGSGSALFATYLPFMVMLATKISCEYQYHDLVRTRDHQCSVKWWPFVAECLESFAEPEDIREDPWGAQDHVPPGLKYPRPCSSRAPSPLEHVVARGEFTRVVFTPEQLEKEWPDSK